MSAKFLEGAGSKLAEQWVANLLTPAFVFWSSGLLAYVQRHGWQPIATLFPDSKLEALQIGIIAAILTLIYLSALIVQRFDTEILRGLEGYWYPGLRKLPILTLLRKHHIKKRDRLLTQWQVLDEKLEKQTLTSTDRAELVRIDRKLRQYPTQDYDFLPTHLGNILRAAERRPYDRYGLDAIVGTAASLAPPPRKRPQRTPRSPPNPEQRRSHLCLESTAIDLEHLVTLGHPDRPSLSNLCLQLDHRQRNRLRRPHRIRFRPLSHHPLPILAFSITHHSRRRTIDRPPNHRIPIPRFSKPNPTISPTLNA